LTIIDAHVHVTPDGGWFGTGLDASEARLLAEMDQAGLTGAVVVPLYGMADGDFVAGLCARHPGRLNGLCMPRMDGGPPRDQLRRARDELGLKGVKLHPRHQNLDPDDAWVHQVLETAADLALPVMICTYPGPCQVPLSRLTPLNYDPLARSHPGATIILAHAGAQRALDAFQVAKANPNVHLEISHVLAYYRDTHVWADLCFIMDKLDRRVIYGSDFPEVNLADYLALARRAAEVSGRCDLESVLGGNLRRLLDID
jgi:hypothetical protein